MNCIEIIGAVIGLVYLILEYRASSWLWPVGIVMSLFYVVIFFQGKFYADAAVNVYYIAANIYGLCLWMRGDAGHTDGVENITHLPKRVMGISLMVFLLIWMAIFIVLRYATDSVAPLGDAFTTAMSVLAMWMLAHKYIEQWILWGIVNLVSTVLYVWKGLYPTAVLYIVYTIVSILGYLRWRRDVCSNESANNV